MASITGYGATGVAVMSLDPVASKLAKLALRSRKGPLLLQRHLKLPPP